MFTIKRAFTLIELLTVISLLLMAAVVVAPTMIRQQRYAMLRESTRRLRQFVQEAHSLAVARDSAVTLKYDEDRHGLRLETEPVEAEVPAPDRARMPPPAIEQRSPDAVFLSLPEELVIHIVSRDPAGNADLTFTGDGRAEPARVSLRLGDYDVVLMELNPATGRLEILEGQP